MLSATSSTTWMASDGRQNSLVASSYELWTAVSGPPTTPVSRICIIKENKRFKLKHFDVITNIDDFRSENDRYVNM